MASSNYLFFSLLRLLFVFSLIFFTHSFAADFEGFDDESDDVVLLNDELSSSSDLPINPPPLITRSESDPIPEPEISDPNPDPNPNPEPSTKTTTTSFEYWDEDEFEGFQQLPPDSPLITETATPEQQKTTPSDAAADNKSSKNDDVVVVVEKKNIGSYAIEIVCVSFLIIFGVNYFTGKRENENLALGWASKFATKDSIFYKNFSLLGIGDKDDSPLLLKEGQTVFKFYASGRRYCQGLLATMELKSRHDLMARLFNLVVPTKDEITIEVTMNDDAMDHVVFALAKKKAAKTMQKEVRDLQRYAGLVSPPSGRKCVSEELSVITESKEVAGDLITEVVLEQVFGDKAFEKFGKFFISMHFSDQYASTHKKMLVFKFALPDINHMDDMTRLVALVPYYIDLVGRYKLSPQARSKTEAARLKAAQEAYKELLNARQEALQKKKAEQKEAAKAKLSAEALHKKEAKERARQMRKAGPRIKVGRA